MMLMLAGSVSLMVLLSLQPAGQTPAIENGLKKTDSATPAKEGEKVAAKPKEGETPLSAEEYALKQSHLPLTGPELLDLFRRRTPPGVEGERVAEQIKKLADKDAAVREKAMGELIAMGEWAVPQLRQAANNLDVADNAQRARECLLNIEGPAGSSVVQTAARQVGFLKPDKALEVLLAYLPYADDEAAATEVQNAVVALAPPGDKPDAVLLKALTDPSPVRRAAAAEVLCQANGRAATAAVRPLLKDPKPTVRLRVALGLVNNYNPEGVPVLIDLLGDLPPVQRKQAEDYLKDLAGEWTVSVPQGNDGIARRLRKEMWTAWWKAVDGDTLIGEFRSRTLDDDTRVKILALIKSLGDDNKDVREKASNELITLGTVAAPLLRQASQNADFKGAAAAGACLRAIEKENPSPLPSIAPRLLALRQPEGAAEAVLKYLPFAESDEAAQQLREILGIVGFKEGKPDAALVKALEDKLPLRRGAAAVALCRQPGEHVALVSRLLKDPNPEVKMRAALALASIRDKEAVPVLIASLEELPLNDGREVEDYLARVAGDKAPTEQLAPDLANKVKVREAWSAWWKANEGKVDLARVDSVARQYGYTLLVEGWMSAGRGSRVAELDANGKTRWEIPNLNYPMYAQVLPGDRVLVAEQQRHRVFESDFTGKVIWEKTGIMSPFICQRLRNGNTFVAGRNNLWEFDRSGKELFNKAVPSDTIMAAQKWRDGSMSCLTYNGTYTRYDASGKETKTFHVPYDVNFGMNGAEVLQNDHVLIVVNQLNKVNEYDDKGKIVWTATVSFPGSATRLPNGNTLVTTNNYTSLTEVDRNGKVVQESKNLTFRPWKAFRR
jgi:HEAT repeat protein